MRFLIDEHAKTIAETDLAVSKRGTIQEIAEATGVNQATVRRALRAEGLTPGRGGYAFNDAVEIVKAIADQDRLLGNAASGRGEGGATQVSAYSEAKALAERHRARKLELENEATEGRLIPREAVTDTGVGIITAVRTALLAIGTRVAPKLAGKTDLPEIARLIEEEVRTVLGVLADPDRFFAELEAEALS